MGKLYIAGRDTFPEHIVLAEGETFDGVLAVLPGVSCSVHSVIDLAGDGASCNLAGLYICGGDERVSFDINVNHKASGTESNQLFNGIAGGSSRTAFNGRIVVREGVAGIKADQENHNLLVSDRATVQTSPQLEIYADDVECSHGATTGFLDEDQLFYMRSRGVPEDEARAFQIISFLAPVLAEIGDDAERERLQKIVEKAARSI